MSAATMQIEAVAEALQAEHVRSDVAGKLTDRAVALLRESGGMRLLQARSHGGFEADPREFCA